MWGVNEQPRVWNLEVGNPIYSRDYQKVGSVADLGRHAFRVKACGWSRDFWLSRGTIRSIASDGAVMLLIEKRQLGQHKLKTGEFVD